MYAVSLLIKASGRLHCGLDLTLCLYAISHSMDCLEASEAPTSTVMHSDTANCFLVMLLGFSFCSALACRVLQPWRGLH